MAGKTSQPDPRDFENVEDYQTAVDDYLADLNAVTTPMDAIRSWREDPPAEGFE